MLFKEQKIKFTSNGYPISKYLYILSVLLMQTKSAQKTLSTIHEISL